ncbi:D-aminoacyl-tRNA deacylase [Geopsychrobacter electrodiphilus]|uniref:D-aminoacyl-tRNA deacylase n=1 Tax=Geopsychrobacter electrodiphilus TaxID=225196 RepID=UPI000364F673|nr:D-aminoacyl-tRNA deacylase [Geopsychrobacter electrodiphilus]
MRAVIQRVSRAQVHVEGHCIGKIGPGLLILLGVERNDTPAEAEYLATKSAGLRIFEDEAGKMNLSLQETGGAALVVSQFTLLGDCRKGRRPGFSQAALPDLAIPLYEHFILHLQREGVRVETGQFQAEMQVELVNDGPVTLLLDSQRLF